MGLEPTRCYHHTDLNRARLPIPPLLRICLRPTNLATKVIKRKKMRKMGLEPTRPCGHKILSLARLPIPTLPLTFLTQVVVY